LLETVPSFPGGTTGVPTFPRPSGGTTTIPTVPGGSTTVPTVDPNYVPPVYSRDIQQQIGYALTAFTHINTKWSFGMAYWLALGAALCAMVPPFLYACATFANYLLEAHRASEVQVKFMIPWVAFAGTGWIASLVGLASRYWKVQVSNTASYHFGIDQIIIAGSRYTIATHFTGGAGTKSSAIAQSSGVALSFGIFSVVLGFITWCMFIPSIYDRERSPVVPFILSMTTAFLWFIAVLVYGVIFPKWVTPTEYYEFGSSYWLALYGGCVYLLPLGFLGGWKVYRIGKKTSREERLMFIPCFCCLAGALFTMSAMGTDFWVSSATFPENHMGLMRGRYLWYYAHFDYIGANISPWMSSAGMATLIVLLAGLALQFISLGLSLAYVLGHHHLCFKETALLNTALSTSTTILYITGVVAYAMLFPFDDPSQFELSACWYTQIGAAVWSCGATVGFALRTQPTPKGEASILAEAMEMR
jgi:hypothetical protein